MHYKIETCSCPSCGAEINIASYVEHSPIPGDYSICGECTAYLKFNDNLSLELCSVDDIVEMPNDQLYELTEQRNRIKERTVMRKYIHEKLQSIFDRISNEPLEETNEDN